MDEQLSMGEHMHTPRSSGKPSALLFSVGRRVWITNDSERVGSGAAVKGWQLESGPHLCWDEMKQPAVQWVGQTGK